MTAAELAKLLEGRRMPCGTEAKTFTALRRRLKEDTMANLTATVLQMVRAHFRRDDSAFASAASVLGRAAKTPQIRVAILEAVRMGYTPYASRPGAQPMQPQRLPTNPQCPFLQTIAPTTFADLTLDPSLQANLDEILVELEYREELAARKLRARNRLLFWGPPGCGKTSSAAAIADAIGVPAYGVSLPKLVSKYIGETGQHLGQLFDAIGPNTVVVFDELDAVGAHRGDADQAASKEFNSNVNTLLTLLDRHKSGVIVATTNRPDIVDPALLRRFDEQIEFPGPTLDQMRILAAKLCEGYGVPLVDVSDCRNYDGVTKTVEREARRVVMRELLKQDDAPEEDGDDGTPDVTH